MLAPFALAYQPTGADWTDPTYTDFWSGLPILVVSFIGLIMSGADSNQQLDPERRAQQ